MKKFFIFIILNLLLCGLTVGQKLLEFDKVREVKLLEMNRDDVRKIFADYKSDSDDASSNFDWFETENSEIRITYSEGTCAYLEGFDVSKWKAEYIEITFNNPIKLKDTGINFSKYKREKMYKDADDIYAYYDKELGIIFRVRKDEIEEINFTPSPKYYNLMCDQEKAKKLSSTKSIFDSKLKDRSSIISDSYANVEKLNLSRTKIISDCGLSDLRENKSCSKSKKVIDVSTIVVDFESDVLTYSYTVSGGKIIGQGSKVTWDLSGVKPGVYTITAAVDDGCGFCGFPKTKSVVVKECPKCSNQ